MEWKLLLKFAWNLRILFMNIRMFSNNRKFFWMPWACAVELELKQGQTSRLDSCGLRLPLSFHSNCICYCFLHSCRKVRNYFMRILSPFGTFPLWIKLVLLCSDYFYCCFIYIVMQMKSWSVTIKVKATE